MGLAVSAGPNLIDIAEDKDSIQPDTLFLITNEMTYDGEKVDHCVNILSP
jgi:hypothetical protein